MTAGLDQLIFYVDDLENLVRWLARTFTYEDPNTGERIVNDPIWPLEDLQGQPLEENARLARTWGRVMHPDEIVSRETLPATEDHPATPYASPVAGRAPIPGEVPDMTP